MDHTMARQNRELVAEMAIVKAQVAELATLLKQQLATSQQAPAAPPAQRVGCAGQVNNGPVTNNITNNTTVVNIHPWDGEGRIYIPASIVKAAFTENSRLMEYCRMTDDERVDAEKAAPYVLEALIDLVRRAHRDPVYRNVYLNPKRADQVIVCLNDKEQAQATPHRWEVRSLVEAIRLLFDGVAGNLHKIVITDQERTQLPFDVQSAASWVPNLYEDEPERFVQGGKVPMAAHLANTRPPSTM